MKKFLITVLLVFSLLLNIIHIASADEKKAQKKKAQKTQSSDKIEKMEKQIQDLQNQYLKMKKELEDLKKQKGKKPVPGEIPAPTTSPLPIASPSLQETPPAQDDEALLKQLQKEMGEEEEGEAAPRPTGRQTGNVFNPDISINADMVWRINHNKNIEGGSPFNLREVEIGFQGNIDPWSRFDAFIGLHKHGDHTEVHVEEAYTTFYRIPLGLQLKTGKFFTAFGKDNTMHQHDRPYVDKPLFVKNYLGHEGMGGTGMSASAMIPLGKVYGEAILETMNDENSSSFTGGKSGKVLYNGHVRLYSDLNDSSNIELGYSHLRGFNDKAATRLTQIQGIDLTYRWKPLRRGKYHSFLLRGEYLWSDRENPDRQVRTNGYYAFGQYQLNRNWYVGARYDYSEFPDLINTHENAISGMLTYYPTEFSYMRLQYKKTDRNFAYPITEWLFQMNFLLGPHGAHKF
ncbi:MAG: OprO/OprP family phosphate-selective porin [Candidatus Eremiobacteraeota bacterium]|nr:OprO/OprP family phosphate-selective porin [Candidatus Eremiobacteraeota bacterium]